MNHEKAIAAALEPLVDDLVALEKRVDRIALTPGPKGEPGRDVDPLTIAQLLSGDRAFVERVKGAHGDDGDNGLDGAGIDAPRWAPGVYRQGVIVTAHIGQHFVAVKDTASAPGDTPDWRRIGTGGFRHRGTFDKDATYVDGDLYFKDFGTFCVVNGAAVIFGSRGAKGERGEPGPRGASAKDGRDGATIVGAQMDGSKLVLVQQDADGAIDHIEADFGPAIREAVRDALMEQAA